MAGFDIEPFLLQGINLGITAIIKTVPGGSPAITAGCDAGELACKMGCVIFPKLRDGSLTQEEFTAIVGEFKAGVPAATFAVALAALKSAIDRTIGGSFKL